MRISVTVQVMITLLSVVILLIATLLLPIYMEQQEQQLPTWLTLEHRQRTE
jgi:hypothetical protein